MIMALRRNTTVGLFGETPFCRGGSQILGWKTQLNYLSIRKKVTDKLFRLQRMVHFAGYDLASLGHPHGQHICHVDGWMRGIGFLKKVWFLSKKYTCHPCIQQK